MKWDIRVSIVYFVRNIPLNSFSLVSDIIELLDLTEIINIIIEPPRRKTNNLHKFRGNREADQRLCIRYSDSTIPPLLKLEISSF